MTQTIARIKQKGKHFEIIVDLDEAMKFKKGQSPDFEAEDDRIFSNSKSGEVASNSDLKDAFGTADTPEIIRKIIKDGEVLVSQEYRDEERDKKLKQIVDFLSRNSTNPQTGFPHSPDRIQRALEEAHVNVKNVPIENQINDIMKEVSKIIPIRIETKKIKVKIPAIHTGKSYNIISQYKEEENWMNDGSLEVVINIPAGIIMDVYDKLNSATHGSAITEEIKNE